MAEFDSFGRQIPDPRPVEVPTGLRKPENLHESMRRMIRTELSRAAVASGVESFEEADDFEVDDGEDEAPLGPYEIVDMVPEPVAKDASDLRTKELPLGEAGRQPDEVVAPEAKEAAKAVGDKPQPAPSDPPK